MKFLQSKLCFGATKLTRTKFLSTTPTCKVKMHPLILFLTSASLFSHHCFMASATEGNSVSKTGNVIFQKTITMDDTNIGLLEVFQDEEPADAVFQFAQRHGLNQNMSQPILENVCLQLKCERAYANILKMPLMGADGTSVGFLEIPEGSEPADVVHGIAVKLGLSQANRDSLIQEVCGVVSCTRLKPLVWKKEVVVDGSKSTIIVVEEGQEPADAIFIALKPFDVAHSQRKIVMDEAKKENVPYTRESAFVYEQGIVMENETSYLYQLLDDGTEPIDKLYQFAAYYKLEEYWDKLVASILPATCALIPCQRQIPLIWRRNFNKEDGTTVGAVEIFKGQEPIDAIDAFCQYYKLTDGVREEILKSVCEELVCTRTVPVVYWKQVDNEAGETFGVVEVLENEEVTDAVTRFLSKTPLSMSEPRLRKYFFEHACTNPRVKCSKIHDFELDNLLVDENGTELGRLHSLN